MTAGEMLREIDHYGTQDVLGNVSITASIREKDVPVTQILPVLLNYKAFGLPYVRPPNAPDAPVLIPWFNPDHEVNPKLAEAAAQELSLLISSDMKVVVGPASSKSNWLLERAVDLANERYGRVGDNAIQFMLLEGEKVRDDEDSKDAAIDRLMRKIGDDGIMNENGYVPITTDSDHPKFMGIKKKDVDRIRRLCPEGLGLMVIDDVYSRGETMQEMQRLLYTIIHSGDGSPQGWIAPLEGLEIPAAVVMREFEMEHEVVPPAPPWLRRVFDAPVLFVGPPAAA